MTDALASALSQIVFQESDFINTHRAVLGKGFLACKSDADGHEAVLESDRDLSSVCDCIHEQAHLLLVRGHVALKEEVERLLSCHAGFCRDHCG